MITGM